VLNEIFDTRIPIENWRQENNNLIGYFRSGEDEYRLVFQFLNYFLGDDRKVVINCAFDKIVNGKPSEVLTLDNKKASQVIGAFYNGIVDKIKNLEYDAFSFVAGDNVEQRTRVYNFLARNAMKLLGGMIAENIPISGGIMTIVTKKNVSDEELKAIENILSPKGIYLKR